MCERAGLRLSDADVAAVAVALVAYENALQQLRELDLPEDEPGFEVAWG